MNSKLIAILVLAVAIIVYIYYPQKPPQPPLDPKLPLTKRLSEVELFIKGIDKIKKEVERDFDTEKYPLDFLRNVDLKSIKNETEKSMTILQYFKSILYYNPRKKNQPGFYDIIMEMKKDFKMLSDLEHDKQLKKDKDRWRKFYNMYAETELPKPIFGDKWKNWGDTLRSTPSYIFSDDADDKLGYLLFKDGEFYIKKGTREWKWDGKGNRFNSPVELEHLKAIVELGQQKNKKIKAFGTSHSWAPICATDGIIVDNRKINLQKGINDISVDPANPITDHPSLTRKGKLKPTVTCSPGLMTGILERKLWERGYSLAASTIEDVFTIGGIAFTSSHGVGRYTTSLSDLIVSLTMVVFNGKETEVITITPYSCPDYLLINPSTKEKDLTPEDIWRLAQVNMGAFGLVWEMTLIVEPAIHAYFVTETAKWSDYFADGKEERKRLAKLTEDWDTIEFWHYPLTFDNKDREITFSDLFFADVSPSDYVYIWKTTSNSPPPGYTVVSEDFDNLYYIWVKQSLGTKFFGKMMTWVYTNGIIPEMIIPRIVAFLSYGTQDRFGDEQEKLAWKIPQWFANHPYPAVSVVEPIGGVLDIEWEVPMTMYDRTGDGLRYGANVYGHLIESVRKEFYENRYPVTISVEMRYYKGSGSPLSHAYVPGLSLHESDNDDKYPEIQRKAFAAPEIVSHSYNPYWTEFYERMNNDILYNQEKFGPNIKTHLAKQYSSIKQIFSYLKTVYRNQTVNYYPFEEERRKNFPFKDIFELFGKVRERFDPHRLFTNPFIDQFFYFENPQYDPPPGFDVLESGGVGTDFKSKPKKKKEVEIKTKK